MAQAERYGISGSVEFDADYRDVASLTALIQSSDIVVLPYDSRDQVTSGVLVDAIAAGRPVVATAFPHAVELLSSGAGLVVDHDDPDAMALALRTILTEPELAANMAAEATRIAPSLGWSTIAAEYLGLADRNHDGSIVAGVNPLLEAPEPNFDHLISMTDERGTFEHALFSEPRPEHGYCTDDMARVLVVTTREPDPGRDVRDLAQLSMRFLLGALDAQGKCRNRMDRHGTWEDFPALDDCWGRSIWGLGTAASRSDDQLIHQLSTEGLRRAMTQRSPWPRAMAFAALGAADVLSAEPENKAAHDLLSDAADGMTGPGHQPGWPWPEARLTYANAVLTEAMIAAGSALDRPVLLRRGLELLDWLLARETRNGHLSVTPVGGSGPEDRGPGFDQQPIEVAALADACARALRCRRRPTVG